MCIYTILLRENNHFYIVYKIIMVVLPIMAVSALIVYADDFVADVGYGVVGPGTVQVLSGTLPSQFRCLVEERCGVARQLEDESWPITVTC